MHNKIAQTIRRPVVAAAIVLLIVSMFYIQYGATPVTTLAAPASTAEIPKRGGTLKVALNNMAIGSFFPGRANHTKLLLFQEYVGGALVAITPDGRPVPYLAESWRVSPNNKVFTFKLRRGVKFHDGAPFNAAAAKFNLDLYAKEQGGLIAGAAIEQVTAVDEYTIRLEFKTPFAGIWESISWGIGFHSPTAIQRHGDRYGVDVVAGAGPWKVVKYISDSELILERNPDYNWGPRELFGGYTGPPYLDRLEITGPRQPATRRAAFEAGEVDWYFADAGDIRDFRNRQGYTVQLEGKAGSSLPAILIVNHAIVQDKQVRIAISHAINRQAILDSPRFDGVGRVAHMVISTRNWGGDGREFVPFNYLYDPARAARLLDEAGWTLNRSTGVREKDGRPLRLTATTIDQIEIPHEPFQGMLKAVGIQFDFRIVAVGAWRQAMDNRADPFLQNSTSAYGYSWLHGWFYSDALGPGRGNPHGLSDKNVDAAFDRLDATADTKRRRAAAFEIQRALLQEAYVVPVIDSVYPYVSRNFVRGVYARETSWPQFHRAWINK